jgi:hypothetical protein
VLWITGEQPLRMPATEMLRQTLERAGSRKLLYVASSGGVNTILSGLGGLASVELLPRGPDPWEGLRARASRWRSPEHSLRVPVRRAVLRAGLRPEDEGSAHIARLWAATQATLTAPGNRQDAVKLASDYHVVTSVSGAVVLETAAQYAQNNLSPAGDHIPSLPEPETWALLIAGLGSVLAYRIWRRRTEAA